MKCKTLIKEDEITELLQEVVFWAGETPTRFRDVLDHSEEYACENTYRVPYYIRGGEVPS